MKNNDTIVAIATPYGKGGVGIVRLSGDKSCEVLDKLFSKKSKDMDDRKMELGELTTQSFKDKCLAVIFYAPKSYTGETVVEFHCHGGRALIEGVLRACLDGGARLAENGEFTKRAFINGKLNLSQSEAVIDMINAESGAELNAKYDQLSGGITKKVEGIQNELLDIISKVEVVIDYPEEDIGSDEFIIALDSVQSELEKLSNTYKVGGLIKSGVNVAVIGRPNVGKSSLLNGLLGYERAIVTNVEGTTRDLITEKTEIEGVRFNLIDTAGIRESKNKIEKIGVDLSRNAINSSDVVLFVVDGSVELTESDIELVKLLKKKNVIQITNKNDSKTFKNVKIDKFNPINTIEISAKKSIGLEEVKNALLEAVDIKNISQSGTLVTNERHFDCIKKALECVKELKENMQSLMADMIALELKKSWEILGEITGTTASEAIVDNIFMKFCLGK